MLENRFLVLLTALILIASGAAYGAVRDETMKTIKEINEGGPYLGLVVPNAFEMNPLLQSPSFAADERLSFVDFAGRRFRVGKLGMEKIVLVMSGLGMLNAGLATQLLLSLFNIKGVLHFGIAGNANPHLQIGDVAIPQYWAHTGLWNWQRFVDGAEDELPYESSGDYTRKIGYLKFSNYTVVAHENGKHVENLLNNVWYQPEEIFPVNGIPEVRKHAFWVPVDKHYFATARKIEGMKLERCINSTTCVGREPVVRRVRKGSSASVFVDNAAYRKFLSSKFKVTPIDMETGAVALVCYQQTIPFIAIRSLSDLAGGGSSRSNEAATFSPLAAQNAVDVVIKFVSLLNHRPSLE